jgi:outer membrane protein OmpA-like peptidoglycan-associated protein
MSVFLTILSLVSALGDDVGTSALPLLQVSTGPRACAMGGSFAGLADDATAVFWNPAGIGQLANPEFFLSHQEWFMGIRDEFASLVIPAGTGRLGIGLVYSGESGIESWDVGNLPGETLSANTGLVGLSYGSPVVHNLYAGGTARFLYDRLGNETGTGVCADLGILARPLQDLTIGLTGRNLGWGMHYENGYYRLPTCFRLGAAWQAREFSVASDFEVPLAGNPAFHIGGEYAPIRALAFRAGYETGPEDITSLGGISGLCLGLGFTLGRFALDYAFAPYGKLGMVHRIGLRSTIPTSGGGRLEVQTIDAQSNEAIPAFIEFSGLREGSRQADANGRAVLARLNEGWLKLRATYPDYVAALDSVYVRGDEDQKVLLSLSKPGRGTIWGMLYDAATKANIPGRVAYQGPVKGEAQLDSENTSYSVKLAPAGRYVLAASGPTADYFPQTCTVNVAAGQMVTRDFYLLKKKAVIVLKGVNFETGKADIRPEFDSILDDAGRILLANPTIVVELGGHTDPREISTAEFPSNWELSQARAEAVRQYLITKFKIDPRRLLARGYADARPIAPNDSDEGMAKNRRTEFVVLEE